MPDLTLADLTLSVRQDLGDALRVKVDSVASYDGTSNPLDLGKDLPIEPGSTLLTVAGVTQSYGTIYTVDYDARQLTFTTAGIPAAGTALLLRYKESRYLTSQIVRGLNQGRKILFPTIYRKKIVTVTLRNLVRDYDLATEVNEAQMRRYFASGHLSFKILNARLLWLGNNDQAYVPFRRFGQQGETGIHLYEMQPAGTTLRLEVAYDFAPLVDPTDVCDVPDLAVDILTEWACSVVADKQEPIRARIDTANVLQATFANPPQTLAKSAQEFMMRVERLRKLLNIEPMVIEPRDIPARWQVGLLR